MKLLDDIIKFCKDLILGDFEQQPGNAAMIVGGLVSLIPVVDQIMDVRDVCGMIFRISRKGHKNCTSDDWVDLSLAAFGCVPAIGSAFKTIVKPLWKSRKTISGALRGSAFIEKMLGKQKGAAIKYMKTFNWAANTQLAIEQVMMALDLCDQFLTALATPRWWIPDDLEGLARDLKPQLATLRSPLKKGMQQGSNALREFVTELIGEDGYRVAQQVAGVAIGSVAVQKQGRHKSAASRTGGTGTTANQKSSQQKEHGELSNKNVQDASHGKGGSHIATRITREVWSDIGHRYKAVIGEHMAHYHHMPKAKARWQQHGGRTGEWQTGARLVTEAGVPEQPMELFPEHLGRINQSGIDGLWDLGNGQYHFVEAKAYESAGAMFGLGARLSASGKSKLAPLPGLDERQLALWYMLGQPKKGLQMSELWLRGTVKVSAMLDDANLRNRWIYVFFAILGASTPPKTYTGLKAGPKLKQGMAPGMPEHIEVSAEVLLRAATQGDVYERALHDKHKGTHDYSDVFSAAEIDGVNRVFESEKLRFRQKNTETAGAPQTDQGKPNTKSGKAKKGQKT